MLVTDDVVINSWIQTHTCVCGNLLDWRIKVNFFGISTFPIMDKESCFEIEQVNGGHKKRDKNWSS